MAVQADVVPIPIQLNAAMEKCPHLPHSALISHGSLLHGGISDVATNLVSNPNGIVQAETGRRIARGNSHQLRGPPLRISL